MLLILEDNLDKLGLLLSKFRDRIAGRTILCADSVTKGQYLVQRMLEGLDFELWLDGELVGSNGLTFLNWLLEFNCKPTFVLITAMGPTMQELLEATCASVSIPHHKWAGPFG